MTHVNSQYAIVSAQRLSRDTEHKDDGDIGQAGVIKILCHDHQTDINFINGNPFQCVFGLCSNEYS